MIKLRDKNVNLITRKDFIVYSVLGCFLFCVPSFLKKPFGLKSKQYFSIKPISGRSYKPSFLAFCKRAKFSSLHQALAAVKNGKIPFEISIDSKI